MKHQLTTFEKPIIDRLFQKYPLDAQTKALVYDYCGAVLKGLETAGFAYNPENRRPNFLSVFGIDHRIIDLFESKTNLASGLFLFNEAVKIIDQNKSQAQIDPDKIKTLDKNGSNLERTYDNLLKVDVFYKTINQFHFTKAAVDSDWMFNYEGISKPNIKKYLEFVSALGPYGTELLFAINLGDLELKDFDVNKDYRLQAQTSNAIAYQYHNEKQVPLTKKQFNVKVINQAPLNYLDQTYPIAIDAITVDGFNHQTMVINRNASYELNFAKLNLFQLDPVDIQLQSQPSAFDPNRYQIVFKDQQLVVIDLESQQISNQICDLNGQCYQNFVIKTGLNPYQVQIETNGQFLTRATLADFERGFRDYFEYFDVWHGHRLWLKHYLTKMINPQIATTNDLMLLNFRNLKTIDPLYLKNYFLDSDQYQNSDLKKTNIQQKNVNIRKKQIATWPAYTNLVYDWKNRRYLKLSDPNKTWIKSQQFVSLVKNLIKEYYQRFPYVTLGIDENGLPIISHYQDPQIHNHFKLKINKSYQEYVIERLQSEIGLENPHLWKAPNFIKPFAGQFGSHWNYNILPTASMLNLHFDQSAWTSMRTNNQKYGSNQISKLIAKNFCNQRSVDYNQVDWTIVADFIESDFQPWYEQIQNTFTNEDQLLNHYLKMVLFQSILEKKFGYYYDFHHKTYHPFTTKSNLTLAYGHWMEPMIINNLKQAISENKDQIVNKYFPDYLDKIDDIQVITDKRTLMFKDTIYHSGLEQLVDVDGLVVDRHSQKILAIVESKTSRKVKTNKYYTPGSVEYTNQISLYSHVFEQDLILLVSARISDPNENVSNLKEDLIWDLEAIRVDQNRKKQMKATFDLWFEVYRSYLLKAINPFTNQYDADLKTIVDQGFANGLKSAPILDQIVDQEKKQISSTSFNH